jgi:uncharacterized iron-regulated membrane protein
VRRTLLALHRWIGINFGLLILAICLSGAVAALGYQWDWLLDPVWRADSSAVDWAAVEETLSAQAPFHKRVVVMAPQAPGLPAVAVADTLRAQRQLLLLEPATGALRGVRPSMTVQAYLRQLHKSLMLPKGLLFIGPMGMALSLFAVSGLILLGRWRSQALKLRLGAEPRLRWADVHRTLGLWLAGFALLASVTSTWFLIDTLLHPLQEPRAPALDRAALAARSDAQVRPLPELVAAAQAAVPGLDVRQVYYPGSPAEAVRVHGQAGAWLVRDRATTVFVDPYSAGVLEARVPARLGPLHRWAHTVEELHYGTLGHLGGLWSHLLYAALGLTLALVVLAGPVLALARAQRAPRAAGGVGLRALGAAAQLATLALFAGAAVFTLQAFRRPDIVGLPAASAASAPTDLGPHRFVLTQHGAGEKVTYSVGWVGAPPMFERVELELGEGQPLGLSGWPRPSGWGRAAQAPTLRLTRFDGTQLEAQVDLQPGVGGQGLDAPVVPLPAAVWGVAGVMLLGLGLGALAWLALVWRRLR